MKCCLCCRGFPAAPAKVSAPLGGGTDGRQGGERDREPARCRWARGRSKAEPPRSPPARRAHPEHPSSRRARGSRGNRGCSPNPALPPRGVTGPVQTGLRATGRGDENHPAAVGAGTGNRFPPGSAAQRPSQPKTVPASTGTREALGCWRWTVPGTSHKGFQRCRRCRAGFVQLLCFLKQPRHPLNARPKRKLIFKQWVEQASTRTHSLANI